MEPKNRNSKGSRKRETENIRNMCAYLFRRSSRSVKGDATRWLSVVDWLVECWLVDGFLGELARIGASATEWLSLQARDHFISETGTGSVALWWWKRWGWKTHILPPPSHESLSFHDHAFRPPPILYISTLSNQSFFSLNFLLLLSLFPWDNTTAHVVWTSCKNRIRSNRCRGSTGPTRLELATRKKETSC